MRDCQGTYLKETEAETPHCSRDSSRVAQQHQRSFHPDVHELIFRAGKKKTEASV